MLEFDYIFCTEISKNLFKGFIEVVQCLFVGATAGKLDHPGFRFLHPKVQPFAAHFPEGREKDHVLLEKYLLVAVAFVNFRPRALRGALGFEKSHADAIILLPLHLNPVKIGVMPVFEQHLDDLHRPAQMGLWGCSSWGGPGSRGGFSRSSTSMENQQGDSDSDLEP